MDLLGVLRVVVHSSASNLIAPDPAEHGWALAVAMLVSRDSPVRELVAAFAASDFSCRAVEMQRPLLELVGTGSPVRALRDLVADSVPHSDPQQRTLQSCVRYYRMWFPIPEEVDACALRFEAPCCLTSVELLLLEHSGVHLHVLPKAIPAYPAVVAYTFAAVPEPLLFLEPT